MTHASSRLFPRALLAALAGLPVLAFASEGGGGGHMGLTERMTHLVIQIGVGVKPEGTDFQSADGKPSRIFTLVLCPEEAAAPYLEFMAGLRAVLDGEGVTAALSAQTAGALYRALTARRTHGEHH